MPPVRFNLATYRRTPAVRRSRLITMAIAKLSSLSSPPSSPPRAVAVAAVVSIALRMNPSTFLPRADRCATSGGPPSGILRGASSLPPLLPPPHRRRRRRRRRRPAQRRRREGSFVGRRCTPPSPPLQFSQPTNPPILLFARLIFQSRSYKFSTPNFPLTKKKVVKTTLCTTVRAQFPPKYPGF